MVRNRKSARGAKGVLKRFFRPSAPSVKSAVSSFFFTSCALPKLLRGQYSVFIAFTESDHDPNWQNGKSARSNEQNALSS
jgi:hypothetical protein